MITYVLASARDSACGEIASTCYYCDRQVAVAFLYGHRVPSSLNLSVRRRLVENGIPDTRTEYPGSWVRLIRDGNICSI